jgi:hypothetical protein
MKVRELIEELSKFDPDAELIMQKYAEGNGYSPLAGVDTGYYIPDSTWSGLFYDDEFTAEDNCMDDEEYAELIKSPLSIVLFPVN